MQSVLIAFPFVLIVPRYKASLSLPYLLQTRFAECAGCRGAVAFAHARQIARHGPIVHRVPNCKDTVGYGIADYGS